MVQLLVPHLHLPGVQDKVRRGGLGKGSDFSFTLLEEGGRKGGYCHSVLKKDLNLQDFLGSIGARGRT